MGRGAGTHPQKSKKETDGGKTSPGLCSRGMGHRTTLTLTAMHIGTVTCQPRKQAFL